MSENFSGMISTEDKEPKDHKNHSHVQCDNIDPRVSVIKEYILKVPDASLKDVKKALTGFSKASEEELKNIVKSANEAKFNELFPKTNIIQSHRRTRTTNQFSDEEIKFLEKYKSSNLKRRQVFSIYKQEFPKSTRNINFLSDYYYSNKKIIPEENEVKVTKSTTIRPTHKLTNDHILAQAITTLYKSGKSPEMFLKIKPVIELIKDPNAIDFAIECLTL